jgi:hypothetical protein
MRFLSDGQEYNLVGFTPEEHLTSLSIDSTGSKVSNGGVAMVSYRTAHNPDLRE